MTPEQKLERRSALKQLEKQYRAERNYTGLVRVYDEYISIGTSWGNHGNLLFKKMYCLARLGDVMEVKRIWDKNKAVLSYSMGKDELYRAQTLLSFFTDQQHTIFVIRQTLIDWLDDPATAHLVNDIIFDYNAVLADLGARIAAYNSANRFR